MKNFILSILLLFPCFAFAENVEIALEKAPIHATDKASINRGAKYFASICMACHTLIYLRYDKVAQAAGITLERMPIKVKQWPNGITPPDLSLEANIRGVDWIYTYLHSFYQDKSRETGVNNLIVPNTAMAGVLIPLQGQQEKVQDVRSSRGIFFPEYQWYDVLEITQPGSMTAQQFDAMVTDIVNFLAYAAEPYKVTQHRIGIGVLVFLIILFVLAYQLKTSYWRSLRQSTNDKSEEKNNSLS